HYWRMSLSTNRYLLRRDMRQRVATYLAGDTEMAMMDHGSPTKAPSMTDLGLSPQADRSLLIVEDDKSFLQRLARAMEGRGFAVTTAESVAEGLTQLETATPAFAVV